jgi:hypothetical protein
MKGFIKHFTAASCFGAALLAVSGCSTYRDLVDPCWPERYNSMARSSVREMSNAQADKGHKLDQTVWNAYFVKNDKTNEGTAVLNEAGKEFLRNLARKQPFPDPQIWLQYPHDVTHTAKREQMLTDRKGAVRNFLTTQTMTAGGDSYQIGVHDHVQPTYPANWTEKAYNAIDIQGKLNITQGGGSSGGGGGSGSK